MRRKPPAVVLFGQHAKFKRPNVRRKFREILFMIGAEQFTARQVVVLNLFMVGRTQLEIVEELGVHQTSVHKSLFGNLVYSGRYAGKRHGGILSKVRKICQRDNELRSLWQEFETITRHNFFYSNVREGEYF